MWFKVIELEVPWYPFYVLARKMKNGIQLCRAVKRVLFKIHLIHFVMMVNDEWLRNSQSPRMDTQLNRKCGSGPPVTEDKYLFYWSFFISSSLSIEEKLAFNLLIGNQVTFFTFGWYKYCEGYCNCGRSKERVGMLESWNKFWTFFSVFPLIHSAICFITLFQKCTLSGPSPVCEVNVY